MNTNITMKSDEIDLVALVKVLWDKKWWIVLSTVICTSIAGIYAFTAKEQWTSKAEIVGPRTLDFETYYAIRKEYQRIVGDEVDNKAISDSLFEKFKFFINSLDEREKFVERSNYYKELVKDESKENSKKIISKLVEKDIQVSKPDAKKDPNAIGYKVEFTTNSADSSQKMLNDYVQHISDIGFQLELKHFLIYFQDVISDLKYEKQKFEKELKIQKKVRLENLNKAFDIAKHAGIKEYARISSDKGDVLLQNIALSDTKIPLSDSKLSDNTYLFMLGEKYLKAQIDVTSQKDEVYPPRYHRINELLQELEPLLLKAKTIKSNTFRYLSSPIYPTQRDWPKRGILLIIGFLFGLFLGSITILGMNVLTAKQKR